MRSDFHEVVIERPRSGGYYTFRDYRVRCQGLDIEALDNLPKKQGYRRPYRTGDESKALSDLIGPLTRFLQSRIGQPWDAVYSEIREQINPDSAVQLHILGHLYSKIDINTYIGDDGKVWVADSFSPRHVGGGDLYVHPDTGLITQMPQRQRGVPGYSAAVEHLREIFGNNWEHLIPRHGVPYGEWPYRIIREAGNHIRVGFERELHKIRGIWYWVTWADVPPPFSWLGDDGTSHFTACGVSDLITCKTVLEGRYRADKRQANRKDLRRYRLRND